MMSLNELDRKNDFLNKQLEVEAVFFLQYLSFKFISDLLCAVQSKYGEKTKMSYLMK